jgi:predicted SAM-dependent methyltransferase
VDQGEDVKINFACGKQTWDGFYCIDAVRHSKATREPDLLHVLKFDGVALVNPVPLPDRCADELHSYHFLEHVYAWEAPALVAEWARLLKSRGRLILELPDLEKACRNLLAGMKDQMSMWPLYGDPGHRDVYMTHRWGWTPETVKKLLSNHFHSIKVLPPVTHGAKVNRDMRVEAIRDIRGHSL